MKYLSLNDLSHVSFSVSNISCLNWSWGDQAVNDYSQNERVHNLIFYQAQGEREYHDKVSGERFYMPQHSMIFIADRTHYLTRAITSADGRDSAGYVAHFDLTDSSGEFIQITDRFILDTNPRCEESLPLFQRLNRHFNCLPPQMLLATADILQILDRFMHCQSRRMRSSQPDDSIKPALKRIQEAPEREFSIGELCALCHMSESTFRRRFRSQTGMSPVVYRNLLRVRKAKLIYEQSLGSVEEIAEQLGFCDAPYLCRTYKKLTGQTFTER